MASWHEFVMERLQQEAERERVRKLRLDNDAREARLAQRAGFDWQGSARTLRNDKSGRTEK
jgi:hypothetical protein